MIKTCKMDFGNIYIYKKQIFFKYVLYKLKNKLYIYITKNL